MQSSLKDTLPTPIRRSLKKLGSDINLARRKRGLPIVSMAERIGVSKGTYLRVEKGDPTVSMGVYAMALFVLGFGPIFGTLIDPSSDEQGLLLDYETLPKRVRIKSLKSITKKKVSDS